jgi:sigma-B regulation protein RsbU (phosphoserine phosphatase)
MAGPRSRGLAPLLSGDRRYGVQRALLHTVPGRAIVIGLVARALVYAAGLVLGSVPTFLSVVDTVAGVALAAGAVYFVYQLLVTAKRRVLWRVRRKLILSYIFVGFIPAILIAAFFLLSGFLLFYNFGSYLVQARLKTLTDQARFLAQSTALEIQAAGGRGVAAIASRRQADTAGGLHDPAIAVVPVERTCAGVAANDDGATIVGPVTAGPWSHVQPPGELPAWIGCEGFAGILAYSRALRGSVQQGNGHLLVRAVSLADSRRPRFAVIVDVVVDDAIRSQLRSDTGVDIRRVTAPSENGGARPLDDAGDGSSVERVEAGDLLSNLSSLIEFRDWETGRQGTGLVWWRLSVSELYDRISSAPGAVGRSFGQGLLLILFIIGGLFLVIEFIALVAGLALAKSITGSVHELFAGTERVRQGDFMHKIAVKSEDQLGELAVSFNQMTASIEDLLLQAAEKKRLEEELRIAREIQMSLLPQGPLVMPGLSVTALCIPAREVGGDYYDFFRLGDRRLGILIADVSGKGTSAALYMAELKGLVLSLSQIHTSPRALMLAADRIIAANLDARSFITMTYAVVDLDAGTMTYARAGHTPLMYVQGAREGAPQVQVLAPDGLVLGLNIDNGEMFARLLQEQTIELRPGDLAVFFTDGITEAMNESNDCFGEGRLALIAEQHAHLTSDELRERVLREVQAFVGGAQQHDDMTMILLKVDDVHARPTDVESPALAERL